MPRDRPAIAVRIFDLREAVAPELILRLDERLRADCERLMERGVDVIDV